ncbi:MAG: hypothetical protein JNK04_16545, partial [Myxococcales bacterium]|nr:hypothetical protein [Myxococcales bacterium]
AKCVVLPGPGEACATNMAVASQCVAFAFCEGDTCKTLPNVGEDCYMGAACLGSLECGEDPEPITCKPLPGPDVCVSL